MQIKFDISFKVDKKISLSKIKTLINKNLPIELQNTFTLEKPYNDLFGTLIFSIEFKKFDSDFINKFKTILNIFKTFFIIDDECRHQVTFRLKNSNLSRFNFNLFSIRLDEDKIFNIFKNRLSLISCKTFYKNNVFLDISKNPDISNILTDLTIPNNLKTVYQDNRVFGNIIFNYFYGSYIYKNIDEFLDILKSIKLTISECILFSYYTYRDVDKLKKILDITNFDIFNNLVTFQNYYKNIELYYNLDKNEQLIKTNWNCFSNFFNSFFNFNFINKKKKFKINYDSERNIFEIIELDFKNGLFKNVSLVDCNISNSLILNSEVEDCKLNSVNLENNIISSNEIQKSFIKDCYLEFNEINDSFVTLCSKVNENKFERCKLKDVFLDDNSKTTECDFVE